MKAKMHVGMILEIMPVVTDRGGTCCPVGRGAVKMCRALPVDMRQYVFFRYLSRALSSILSFAYVNDRDLLFNRWVFGEKSKGR